jgi:hypothetical protein
MLAGGEQQGRRGDVPRRRLRHAVCQAAHAHPALHGDTGGGSVVEHGFVQHTAGQAERREGQGSGSLAVAGVDLDAGDGHRTKAVRVHPQPGQRGHGFTTKKLAADLVMRAGFALQQQRRMARYGQIDAGGGAGKAAANN